MYLFLQIIFPAVPVLWLLVSRYLNEWADRQPRHYSTRLPWDTRIPFLPVFALPYLSGNVLGMIGYLVLLNNENLPRVFFGYVILFCTGVFSYIVFPCRVERREALVVTDFSTHLLARFQRASKPYNSFPSMHVAYGIYSALVVGQFSSVPFGLALLAYAVLVALSTLFAKQHHLLDVFAGALLAVGVFWVIR